MRSGTFSSLKIIVVAIFGIVLLTSTWSRWRLGDGKRGGVVEYSTCSSLTRLSESFQDVEFDGLV